MKQELADDRATAQLDTPSPPDGSSRWPWRQAGDLAGRYLGVGVVLIVLCVYLSIAQSQFATYSNFLNILETNAVLLVLAVGLTFVLIVGGFDLSIGGLLALTGIVLWELVKGGMPAALAAVLVVAMATMLGLLVNGFLIGKVGLSFLVVTLGSASLFRGIAQVRSGGQSQSMYTVTFLTKVGSGKVIGVPILVVIALAVLAAGIVVLRYSGFGRMVYAVGGNPEAARMAGINVTAIRIAVFGISGGLAGLAAIMDTGRLAAASPNAATGIELTAGAAVLLGGTSFMGGRGTLLGTLLGVLFLGVLSNGITLVGVSAFWQGIVSGGVLVTALLIDRLRNRPSAA